MMMVLTTQDVEEITDRAFLAIRKAHRQPRGQQLHPSDNIEYWIIQETLKLLNERYA